MKRTFFMQLGWWCFLLIVRGTSTFAQPAKETLPNIVFIIVDDFGWRDLGYKGNTFYETPNIDKLSKEGMVFNFAYSNAPNCAPTRAALMSGEYGPRTGIYTVGTSERGDSKNRKLVPVVNKTVLDAGVYTLPEALKAKGYATGLFGKWHLGDSTGTSPEGQGFDVNVGGGMPGSPKSYFSPYQNRHIKDGKNGEELTERLTSEALSFIDKNKAKPFFVYLPYYAVHVPLQSTPALIEKYKAKPAIQERQNATYAGMIETVDTQVGRLLEHLQQSGLSDNTIIVFTSDNGGFWGSTSTAPLRGSKGMLYEGGIRIPLIVKWPAKIKAGSTSDQPVLSMDFYPTFLAITGAKTPAGKILDGQNLLPLLTQKGTIPQRDLFWHFPAYLEAPKGMGQIWRQTPGSAIRRGNWKLVENFETNTVELFNLKEDEYEKTNLAGKYPATVTELLGHLRQWRTELHAFIPTTLNPGYTPENL